MPSDFLHQVPDFLETLLKKDFELQVQWHTLTPLMQNEWICYMTIPKKEETKQDHVRRFVEEVKSGGRRPCCWPGCPHRRDSARKWFR